jgi:hypothetical protein
VRPSAFECERARKCWMQGHCDSLRYIFNINGLQSRLAAAKHSIDWKPLEELDDSREKRVVRPKHHGRTDKERIDKGRPDCQFAFTALANIE